MYPHTITIYHKESTAEADTYSTYVLDGVYIQAGSSLQLGSTSFTLDQTTLITVNKQNTDVFNFSWKLSGGDKIVKGVGQYVNGLPQGFTFAMLEDAWTVIGYDIHNAETDLDGIEIHCK